MSSWSQSDVGDDGRGSWLVWVKFCSFLPPATTGDDAERACCICVGHLYRFVFKMKNIYLESDELNWKSLVDIGQTDREHTRLQDSAWQIRILRQGSRRNLEMVH